VDRRKWKRLILVVRVSGNVVLVLAQPDSHRKRAIRSLVVVVVVC